MKSIKLLSSMLFIAGMAISTVSFGQVKVGTNPTTINPANNLEVEASTAERKLSVNKTTGKLTIADGSQGNEKILMSDANGVATWRDKGILKMEEIVFIGEQPGTYTISPFNDDYNVLKDRIPLVPRPGSLPGYDGTTRMYKIQEDGYYKICVGALGVGTIPLTSVTTGTRWRVYMYPFLALDLFDNINTGTGPVLSVFWYSYMKAGQDVGLFTTVSTPFIRQPFL
jgi:hypothetical protein